MKIKEFRDFTKDLPEDATVYVYENEMNVWNPVTSMEITTRDSKFAGGKKTEPSLLETRIDLR